MKPRDTNKHRANKRLFQAWLGDVNTAKVTLVRFSTGKKTDPDLLMHLVEAELKRTAF